jgi:acylpyruvate hydrolase
LNLSPIFAWKEATAVRLVTYTYRGSERAGAVFDDWVVDLQRAGVELLRARGDGTAPIRAAALLPSTVRGLLQLGPDALSLAAEAFEHVRASFTREADRFQTEGVLFRLQEVRLRAPVPNPAKIICLGLNYRDHAREAGAPIPEVPELFAKYPNALIGPGEPVVIPRVTDQVDYEAELAVVIGRPGRYIPEAEAYDYVAGYMAFNDISARDFQFRGRQWMPGKIFDGFAPTGPWLVTRDEIPDPHALRVSLDVGEERLQDSNTGEMIFKIPQVIAFISQILTLEPGDIIATGTPAGVGFARKPPRFLRPGETVRVLIDRIGTLENPVVRET